MGRAQREKGKRGEREFAGIMRAELGAGLGEGIHRNLLGQCRDGGKDLGGLGGWYVEVKRVQAPSIGRWWAKVASDAHLAGERPALAWRPNGEEWLIFVQLTPKEFAKLIGDTAQ